MSGISKTGRDGGSVVEAAKIPNGQACRKRRHRKTNNKY